jgi:hypothetical protein
MMRSIFPGVSILYRVGSTEIHFDVITEKGK